MFIDPDGYCTEVGALLTWVDCGNPFCPTSSLWQPTRYYSGDNRPKYKNYVKQHQIAQTNHDLENEVNIMQMQLIAEASQHVWQAHIHNLELQGKAQREQDQKILQIGSAFAQDPLLAVDAAANVTSVSTWYLGYAAFTSGVSIPVVGEVIIIAVGFAATAWSVYRFADSVNYLLHE